MKIKDYMAVADIISIFNTTFGFLAIIMVLDGDLSLSVMFILFAVILILWMDGWPVSQKGLITLDLVKMLTPYVM